MNFWSYIINGIGSIMTWLVYGMAPTHTQVGLVASVTGMVNNTLSVTFITIFSNMDMTVPMITFGICAILELVKTVYASWRWFKRILV